MNGAKNCRKGESAAKAGCHDRSSYILEASQEYANSFRARANIVRNAISSNTRLAKHPRRRFRACIAVMTIATWMRAEDEPLYRESFKSCPGVSFLNAREGPVELASADGLLLTGGRDLAAESLTQPVPSPSPIGRTDLTRDRWELMALARYFSLSRPILAICRGHQVLNVALGGTLLLDIPGHDTEESYDREVQALRHAKSVAANRTYSRVNSSHHQAIDRLADDLVVEAWSASDAVIEQIRHAHHPWCVGVQYHPERSRVYDSLFQSFATACESPVL